LSTTVSDLCGSDQAAQHAGPAEFGTPRFGDPDIGFPPAGYCRIAWVLVVGSDTSLELAQVQTDAARGTEFDRRTSIVLSGTRYRTVVSGFATRTLAEAAVEAANVTWPLADGVLVRDLNDFCPNPEYLGTHLECR